MGSYTSAKERNNTSYGDKLGNHRANISDFGSLKGQSALKKYDTDGDIVDMVIVDAKLSQGTNFTSGQTAAKNNIGGNLSYKPINSIQVDDLNQSLPTEILQGDYIKINAFFKAYGDGDKTFVGIN